MKILASWLREFLSADVPTADLPRYLLLLGFEVSDIARIGPGFSGVVVGEVLEVRKHPKADRLSLCSVTDGRQTLSIVCGAPNVAAGARVPVALVGAKLPGGRVIEAAVIRGERSQGMICSSSELGLGGNGEGILVLPPDTPVGQDAAALLGGRDCVLDVEITPNRPDCLSHLGLARELSIYFGTRLKAPEPPSLPPPAGMPPRRAAIEDPAACGRYIGREITGVKNGPSPGWMARRLEALGIRSISALVDVTNYVLLEMGHPLHVFDAERLQGDRVTARKARAGERLKALDDREYSFTPEDLVIADSSGPAAVAGVIGGEPSSVGPKTTRVFLEAAHFNPGLVRRTSRRLGLRTESSFRFERGLSPEMAGLASERAAELILSLCGGTLWLPADEYPARPDPATISVSAERINKILGTSHSKARVEGLLRSMAGKLVARGEELLFHPPPHRLDLATVWDLAEEAGRHLGYDSIPSEAGPVRLQRPRENPLVEAARAARERLASLGYREAYGVDFICAAWLDLCGLGPSSAGGVLKAMAVANPVSADQAYLRPTLLPGLLQSAAYNLSRGAEGVRLFETGSSCYWERGESASRACVAGVAVGLIPERAHWRRPRRPAGFFDAKGAAAELLARYPEVTWEPGAGAGGPWPLLAPERLFHPKALLRAETAQGTSAVAGLLHPAVLDAFGLPREAAAFVVDLGLLAQAPPPDHCYRPVSPFPAVTRDLSIVVDTTTSYAAIDAVLRDVLAQPVPAAPARPPGMPGAAGPPRAAEAPKSLGARWDLVDVYTGPGLPAGRESLTLRLTFSREDRTLRDEEVAAVLARAVSALKSSCGAALRGGAE